MKQPHETEHFPGDPEYSRACQDIIDEAQWMGRNPTLPEKVVVHHLEEQEMIFGGDNVKHVYRREK